MRVGFCHFSSDSGGGSDLALRELVTGLYGGRIEPLMILDRNDPMQAHYRSVGIPVAPVTLIAPRRRVQWRSLARYLLGFWPSVWAIAACLKRERCAVLHVNTLWNLQAAFAARLAGIPLLWHVREVRQGGRIDRILFALAAWLATRVIAISRSVAQDLAGAGAKLALLPCGVAPEPFLNAPDQATARRTLKLPPSVPLVVCVGRIEPWKGQQILVEAMDMVWHRFPDTHCAFVGAAAVNKPEYALELRTRCQHGTCPGQWHWPGASSEVPLWMAAADVLVLPSIAPEPFGRTVIEAMLTSTPVIATAAGGPLDTVRPDETGYLVPPGDPDALAAAIVHVFSAAGEARRIAAAACKCAREKYCVARVVKDMEALLTELESSGVIVPHA